MGGMKWSRDVERNRAVLMSTLALLISFAGMADRLPGMPMPFRCELLLLLRQAEIAARSLAFAQAQACGAVLPREAWLVLSASLALPGDDTERLAPSFRALAFVLAAILARAKRFGWAHHAGLPGAANASPRHLSLQTNVLVTRPWGGLSGRNRPGAHASLAPP